MQFDLKSVIETVGKEKNIDKEILVSALKEAILSAARKHYGDRIFEAQYNEDTQEIELVSYKTVVSDEEFDNENKQISLSQAKEHDDTLQVGDEIGEPLSTDELGRIAAQSAKQAIVQKVIEAEKDQIVSEFREKKYELINGQVKRFDKSDVIVDLGSTDGILPVREQIPGEKFKPRDRVSCFILDVKRSSRGPQVILSRSNPELLIKLFEQEVTEISDGIIGIHSAARDPGSRSKIAVFSNDPSVDPVGACVGVKGVRVQAIVQELKGEKIDIIPYDRDPARFVCNALAPAEPTKVVVNERLHIMEVVVPDDHLSLAIGKRGQNVRLAAQLTGWKVDIRSESKMKELMSEYKKTLSQISILGEMRAEILINEGYKDPLDVSQMDVKHIISLLRLSEEDAQKLLDESKALAEKISAQKSEDEYDFEEFENSLLQHAEHDEATESTMSDEAELENLVAKKSKAALLDPDKIEVSSIPQEELNLWLEIKGIGEQTAAALVLANFKKFEDIINTNSSDIAYKTGLPLRLTTKILNEVSKISKSMDSQ